MNKAIDDIWEKIHSSQAWGKYPSENVIRFVARNFYNTDRKRIKILDFGCGQGANTWFCAREGFDVYAFDGSSSAISKTKNWLEKEGLNAKLEVEDGISVEYEDDFFDAVIDNYCIYANKLEDIETMYKKIYAMLKKDGKLFTACFGEELDGVDSGIEIEPGTFQDIKTGVLADRGTTHIFTKDSIVRLLKKIGFSKVQCDWIKYTDNGRLVHDYICVAQK